MQGTGVKQAKEPQEAKFAEELSKMEYEPLLPIEKKLIGYSLLLGSGLLVVLIVVSHYWLGA